MSQPREESHVQCLECGRWYRALPTHLLRTHDVKINDYRSKHGIPIGTPLVSIEWSKRQAAHNVEREANRDLSNHGPRPGFRQEDFVKRQRADHYKALAASGTAAAAERDKTEDRRRLLAPYPVTPAQAAERLGCSPSAAYTFLAYCVSRGVLRRVGRGSYDTR